MPTKANQKYRQAAQEFARRVVADLGDRLDSIILYGSVARDEARRASDIDILVISPDPNGIREKLSEKCGDLMFEGNYGIFISLIQFGHKDFDWHARVRSPFIHNVFEDGAILYDIGTYARVRDQAVAAGR